MTLSLGVLTTNRDKAFALSYELNVLQGANSITNAMSAYAEWMFLDTEAEEVKVTNGSYEEEMASNISK